MLGIHYLLGRGRWKTISLFLNMLSVILFFTAHSLICKISCSVDTSEDSGTTLWVHKKEDTILLYVTSPNINQFSKFSTDRLSSKFATRWYLNILPCLKRVATLPCQISVFKNFHARGVHEANCRVKLSSSKFVEKYFCTVIQALFHSLAIRLDVQGSNIKKLHDWTYKTAATKKKMPQQNVAHDHSQSDTDYISLMVTESNIRCSCLIFDDNKV